MKTTRTILIISVLIALIVGAVSGGLYMRHKEQKRAMFFIQAALYSDLQACQLDAFRAYLDAPPEAGIWAQNNLLQQIRIYKMKMKGWPSEKFDSSVADSGFAHARLVKLYEQIGDQEARDEQLEIALSELGLQDQEALFRMLENTDGAVKDHYVKNGLWR